MTWPGQPQYTAVLLTDPVRGSLLWELRVAEHLRALPEDLRGPHGRALQRHATVLGLPARSWLTSLAAGILAYWLGGLTLGYPFLWILSGEVRPSDTWLALLTVTITVTVLRGHAWLVAVQLPHDLACLGLKPRLDEVDDPSSTLRGFSEAPSWPSCEED
ncbi:hypothetical protein [Deinococcus sp. S9]|uniref:hypothetical protein n=1 Tax=Deinococcus sp. S9 TaxID=2545754 RepID=UPI0010553297|nr:hypothetical protein [Deinococcus sp. S9]TDE84802.1 hypothetical protein E0686_15150 [Deinococcus sp. S9]